MAITFGRGKRAADSPVDPPAVDLNAHLVRDIENAAKKGFTGALEVTARTNGATARLFLFDGRLYAVGLDNYEPSVLERLTASGAVSAERARSLRADARDGTPAGVQAVHRGWLAVEALATVHQEYLLASLGAVLTCGKVKVMPQKDLTTDAFCTLPLPVEPLLEAVRVRAQRLATTWPGLSPVGSPATIRLRATGTPTPANLSLPEFAALLSAVDGHRTVDEVAAVGGFTRAEAVHLAGLLAAAGVVAVEAGETSASGSEHLTVPEAFGHVVEPEPEPE
ncbi:MAG: hypothetical protein NTX29_13700, partial [Actinobacteria bacterium]|nr:hypothetical protein [Actinomycetota bacterium]